MKRALQQLLVLAAVLGAANKASAQAYYVVSDSASASSGSGSGATAKARAKPVRYASRVITVSVGGRPTQILISEELSRVTACYEWDAGENPPATYKCKSGVGAGFNARAAIETLARGAFARNEIDAATFAAMLAVPPPVATDRPAASASGAPGAVSPSGPASSPAPSAAPVAPVAGAGDGLPGGFDGAPIAAPPVATP